MRYAIAATATGRGFDAVVVDRAPASPRSVRRAGPFELRAEALDWALRELRQVEILAALQLADLPIHPEDIPDEPVHDPWAGWSLSALIDVARAPGPHAEAARREFVRRLENLDSDCFLQARFEGATVDEARRFAFETVGRSPREVAERALRGALDAPDLASTVRVQAWLDDARRVDPRRAQGSPRSCCHFSR